MRHKIGVHKVRQINYYKLFTSYSYI